VMMHALLDLLCAEEKNRIHELLVAKATLRSEANDESVVLIAKKEGLAEDKAEKLRLMLLERYSNQISELVDVIEGKV